LNEGVWPRRAESGPWLNRTMRDGFGLPPAELRVGIAAHDLYMAASAPEVVLSRARKDEAGTPTVPSRWLARLEAVLKAANADDRVKPTQPWAAWALALDEPAGAPKPCRRPRPCPPPAARPRELWATDVELLMRDPYAVYARRILGLRALDPVDADPGLPERGQIIHRCLEAFVTHPECGTCEDQHALLLGIGRGHFARHAESPQVRALWWPRFEAVARWFVDLHKSRAGEIATVRAELEGALEVDVPTGRFRLRARADRVELRHDGGVSIVDYKTGTVPRPDEVRFGLKPQLLVEAMIAAEGGFKGLPAGDPTEILYWGLKGGEIAGEVGDPVGPDGSLPELLMAARSGLERLLAHFDDPSSAYIAVPRPEIAPAYGDYDHLARAGEWRDEPADLAS
jgi:ATP-dependent helicase/nuclease subunit B